MGLVVSMGLFFAFLSLTLEGLWLMKEKIGKHHETILLQEEAAVFLHYLKRELDGASGVQISHGRILFFRGSDQYDYRLQGEKIIRKKNSMGHVTVCYDVKDFVLSWNSQSLEMRLVLERNHASITIDTMLDVTGNIS